MQVITPGHVYELDHRGFKGTSIIEFVNMESGSEKDGPLSQEYILALIDRTQYCDACLPWSGNKEIIYHLRMALVLHEARALVRKAHKGLFNSESVDVGLDGHFMLPFKDFSEDIETDGRTFELTNAEPVYGPSRDE